MSRLEKDVIPFLGPMLRSAQPARLRPSQQKLLATWAVKTAFMLEQIHRGRETIPMSEYGRFYAIKQAPPGYVVWFGLRPITDNMRSGAHPFMETRQQRIDAVFLKHAEHKKIFEDEFAAGRMMFRSTVAIGNVAFQVLGHNLKIGLELGVVSNQPLIDVTRWIWPVQSKLWWPPRHPIEKIGGFDGLHNVFKVPK